MTIPSTDYAPRNAPGTPKPWKTSEDAVAAFLESLWGARATKIGMDRDDEDIPVEERSTEEFGRDLDPPDWAISLNDCLLAHVEVKTSDLESHGGWLIHQRSWEGYLRYRAQQHERWLASIGVDDPRDLPGFVSDLTSRRHCCSRL